MNIKKKSLSGWGNNLNIFSIRIKTGRFTYQVPRAISEKPKYEIDNLLELQNIL